jgi:hypothetical protein
VHSVCVSCVTIQFIFRIPVHSVCVSCVTIEGVKSGTTGNNSHSGVNLAVFGQHGGQRWRMDTVCNVSD